jgi:hypothetical protein
MKVVTDGCSKYKHSEVGSKLFSQLFALKTKEYLDKGESICEENFIDVVNSIFEKMIGLCNDDCFLIRNYCFTILVCFEFEDEFVIYSCGDGYIIKEDKEGISFERLSDGDYPCYYIYNYIEDKSEFEAHKEEKMIFKVTRFSKSEYCNVGIASDGLRYVEDLPKTEKVKDNFFDFMEFLRKGASIPIERFINRWNDKNGKFHDDISIVF